MIQRRTPSEREAYLQGFETGARMALKEVARLNFAEVAQRAQTRIDSQLELMGVVVKEEEQA